MARLNKINLINDILGYDVIKCKIDINEIASYLSKVDKAVDTLFERDKIIIKKRYYDGYLCREIGNELNLSHIRIHQLIKKSLNMLRHHTRLKFIING